MANGREECGHMNGVVLHRASSISHYFVSDTFFLIMHICLWSKFPNCDFRTETKPEWNANPKPIGVGGHLLIWPVRCLLHPYQTIISNCFIEFIYYIIKGISGAKLVSFFLSFFLIFTLRKQFTALRWDTCLTTALTVVGLKNKGLMQFRKSFLRFIHLFVE